MFQTELDFPESTYVDLVNKETSLSQKQELLSSLLFDKGMENNYQRDFVCDLYFLALDFSINHSFDYQTTLSLFELITDEIETLLNDETYIKLDTDSRSQAMFQRLIQKKELKADVVKDKHWYPISTFLAQNLLVDLDLYHYAFTHLPKYEKRVIHLNIDTPIGNFKPLTPPPNQLDPVE